jgi:PTH1 family peptidyl-tRNA hydrolase
LRVIVGLGNPGEQYARTRHNVGARVLERASAQWSIPLQSAGFARMGIGRIGLPDKPVEIVLAIPLMWMNQSGQGVNAILDRVGCLPQDVAVVHDDLDLETGRLRIKRSGGAGGHNGVLSIITELNTDQFYRVKIGVGRPVPGRDAADYVLEPFLKDETIVIDASVDQAVLALECLVLEGIDAAMNKFNVHDEQEGDE